MITYTTHRPIIEIWAVSVVNSKYFLIYASPTVDKPCQFVRIITEHVNLFLVFETVHVVLSYQGHYFLVVMPYRETVGTHGREFALHIVADIQLQLVEQLQQE